MSLEKFLILAKKNTYANENIKKQPSSRLKSNDYEFSQITDGDNYLYHDTYFGGENFIGEEVVYKNEQPIWGMNYYGNTIDKNLSEEAMDNALRPALMLVGNDNSVLPVRGPKSFTNKNYKYSFESKGTIENFSGTEKIFKNDNLIFVLHCHGGLIK